MTDSIPEEVGTVIRQQASGLGRAAAALVSAFDLGATSVVRATSSVLSFCDWAGVADGEMRTQTLPRRIVVEQLTGGPPS